jgi:diguanylate cyclase (GGDEF)-like protein
MRSAADDDVSVVVSLGAVTESGRLSPPMLRRIVDRAVYSVRRLREALPQGRLLPASTWRKRHVGIVVLLWGHVFGLTVIGLFTGHSLLVSVALSSVIGAAALIAGAPALGRKVRTGFASFGLVSSSALLIYFWHGSIEGHFHFFFVVGVLTLYQDWFPFLMAMVFVLVHHGVLGTIAPRTVYNHADAIGHPWTWAVFHALFVVATSIANVVTWRVTENLLRESLTGLPGRVVFMDRLAHNLARLDRGSSTVAVFFVDLDRFKVINDSLGHGAGDRLLVAVAERLQRTFRQQDTVSRLGGDEFVVLCMDVGDEAAILSVAQRAAAALAEPLMIEGLEVQTTASIGIALTTDPTTTPEALMREADIAMYRAKERGGGNCEVFDKSMHERVTHRMQTETALRLAIKRGEFRLFYQPEVSLATGEIIAVEALIRWQHPERGLLGPDNIISIAEDTGLIIPIGAWAIQEACRQLEAWRQDMPEASRIKMRVNLSPCQLTQPDLVQVISQALVSTGTDPSDLDLELTESTMMDDIDATLLSLQALRSLGVRLSVDDFGTGHSSFSYLKDLPVHCLKIDRSFVNKLGQTPTDSAIVGCMVDLAHLLGLSVTAEGVEYESQLENLKALGCDSAQGFYMARPLPPDEVAPLLAREHTLSITR